MKYKFLKKCLKKSYKSNRNNTSVNLFNKLVQRYLDGKLIWTDELFDTHTVILSGIFPKEFRFLKKKFMT